MFQSWNVPPGICAALMGEAQRQEQMNTGMSTLLQGGRVACNWVCTPSAQRCVFDAVQAVRSFHPVFFMDTVHILGVQDITCTVACRQGYHQDIRGRGRALTIVVDTGDRPLGTELIRTTTSCDEDTLSEWILQTNMAGDTSNRVRRSSRKPPPPRPHGVEVYRTQSSGLVFDPAVYHRGTEHSGTRGHRVFIQLATGTTGHGALLKANKLTTPWNLPVGMHHMTGHECKDDDARDIHCIKASQESGAAHPDP